jgi:hypothetical protein
MLKGWHPDPSTVDYFNNNGLLDRYNGFDFLRWMVFLNIFTVLTFDNFKNKNHVI